MADKLAEYACPTVPLVSPVVVMLSGRWRRIDRDAKLFCGRLTGGIGDPRGEIEGARRSRRSADRAGRTTG